MVERTLGAREERQEAVVAPARSHIARIPDAREQLKVAQRRRRERLHEVRHALLVTADRDHHERGEARHLNAVARPLPLGLALVLRDLDVEVGEVRGVGEDAEELFDVGGPVPPAERQLCQLRPRQRPVAIRHRPGGDLQLLEPWQKLGAERRPGRTLRRYLELLERGEVRAHEGAEGVPIARGGGEVDKDGAPAICAVCDDVAQAAEERLGDVVRQEVVPEPERDAERARAVEPCVQDLFLCVEGARGGEVEVEGCPEPGHGEGEGAPAAADAPKEERCAPAGLAVGPADVDVAAKVEHAGHDLRGHPSDRGQERTEVLDVRRELALPALEVGEAGLEAGDVLLYGLELGLGLCEETADLLPLVIWGRTVGAQESNDRRLGHDMSVRERGDRGRIAYRGYVLDVAILLELGYVERCARLFEEHGVLNGHQALSHADFNEIL